MGEICPKCGLPKEICACGALVKEQVTRIRVYSTKKRFGKLVTIIEGLGTSELEGTMRELKRSLACGGTAKGGIIILQGNHKRRVYEMLPKLGYDAKSIDVIEREM